MQFSRRKLLAGGAALGFAMTARGAGGSKVQRPNILWLVSEDNNPFIGAYGDKLAHTPAIDHLAQRGVLFRNAFSTAPVCAPSRFSLITGAPAESNAPANHMRARSTLPDRWRTTPEFMRSAGYYCTNNPKTDYNCAIDAKSVWDDSSTNAHYRNRPAEKPFFSVFNFMTTHESSLFRAVEGRVQPADVTVPPQLPDTPAIRSDIAAYYNLMERMDGQVAAHLSDLAAAGLAEDTIVFYYGDNGGVLPKSKRYCSDAGLRVPLIACYPRKWAHLAPGKPGSTIVAPVTLMDLPPTILALAEAPVPAQMTGTPLVKGAKLPRYAFGMRNRMDERYDFVRTITDGRWRYTRNYMRRLPSGQYGAFEWIAQGYQSLETEYRAGRLTPKQAEFFQPRSFEEIYDLAGDPHELNNLATISSAGSHLRRLSAALDSHMLRINDNGFIPEGCAAEGHDASRRPGTYPLRQLMALGSRVAARDPVNLPEFLTGLKNQNEVVRFWNAQGLIELSEQAATASSVLLQAFAAEPSPQVRVAIAEAIGLSGERVKAAQLLSVMLDSEADSKVKLQALNALTHIGAADAQTLLSVKNAETSKDEYISRAAKYHSLVATQQYRPDAKIFGGFAAGPD